MSANTTKPVFSSSQLKIDAIQRVLQGETKASVAREMGVPESTLRGWCKNEYKIKRKLCDESRNYPEPMRKYPKLEEALTVSDNIVAPSFNNVSQRENDRVTFQRLGLELGLNTPDTNSNINYILLSQWKTLLNQQQLKTNKVESNSLQLDHNYSFWNNLDQYTNPYETQEMKPVLNQQFTELHHQNVENLCIRDNYPNRSVLDNLFKNNNLPHQENIEKDSVSQHEAIAHGEKFLKWLESCSDPSVSMVQISKFKALLNNIKIGFERKNCELPYKTKAKRK